MRFKQWLVREPLPARRAETGSERYRSRATADAVLGTVCEFYRFCAQHDLVNMDLMRRLHERRYLRFLPPDYEAGEENQFRMVRSRVLTFAVAEAPFEFLAPDQVESLTARAGNARDRLLVAVIGMTGMRIGEALGLHGLITRHGGRSCGRRGWWRAHGDPVSSSRSGGCSPVIRIIRQRRRPGARSVPATPWLPPALCLLLEVEPLQAHGIPHRRKPGKGFVSRSE